LLEVISGFKAPDISCPGDLRALLNGIEVSDELLAATVAPSPHRPYGRRVLLDTAGLEGMIAKWNPGVPCAVHDHGKSAGAVKVMAGSGTHRQYHLAHGKLQLVAEDPIAPGDILLCGPAFVHAMESGPEPLVTLHLYSPTIPHMIVWDVTGNRTLKVDGGCGAWIPGPDELALLLEERPGLVAPW
jgi:predicted metal-dependent enzyme (double-stranded beta helix superfamily)